MKKIKNNDPELQVNDPEFQVKKNSNHFQIIKKLYFMTRSPLRNSERFS